MIVSSLDGKRILFSTPPRNYYVIRVGLVVSKPAVIPPFSGKVVKSLLIKGNSLLNKIFTMGISGVPKPIHVSPIGYYDNGRVVFLWKKSGDDRVLEVVPDKEYFFIVSCSEEVYDEVFNAVLGLNSVELFNTEWIISTLEIESYRLPSENPLIRLDDAESVKIMFRSPVQPIDPYRKTGFKRLNIVPSILLSYNAGEITRMYRREPGFWRILDLLNYVLVETKTFWKTIRLVDVLYDKNRKIPALTGYVKYWVNLEDTGKDIKLIVENILSHAQIMGVGSSRSIGLGHIDIKIEKNTEKTNNTEQN